MTAFRSSIALAAAVLGTAVAAAPADAWTVSRSAANGAGTTTFTAASGEVNTPAYTRSDVVLLRFTDGSGPAGSSAPCAHNAEAGVAQCPYQYDFEHERVVFKLGDRNDKVLLPDDVGGVPPATDLYGETGNDTISNLGLSGRLDGGSGSDVLRPGLGADRIAGGTGLDAIDYSERTKPVTINFFTVADSPVQGEEGEGDSFVGTVDVEVAFGGKAGDKLTGNGRSEQFIPGPGQDTVSTRQGDDIVDARDGAKDTIECGLGADTVYADTIDVVAADCENVSRSTSGPGLAAPGGGGTDGPPSIGDAPGGTTPPSDGDTGSTDGGGFEGVGFVGEDPAGASGGPGAELRDSARPIVRLLHLSAPAIRRGGTRTAKAAKARTATTLRFSVSERASLRVRFDRLGKGGRRVRVTTLKRARVEGVVGIRLTARIGATRLKAGRYRLTVVATDVAGNVSRAKRVTLKVTR